MTRKSLFFMACTLVAVLLVGLAHAHGVGLVAGAQHQPMDLLPLIPLMGVISDKVSQTASQNPSPALDLVRANQNIFLADFVYFTLNDVRSSTIATMPVCAQATTATKAKTTNSTVLTEAGVAVALAATDNYWTLAPTTVLAAASFRRYWLIDTGGVASVQASTDSTVSAASCRFIGLPANGSAIVGTLTVATDASHTFTPATTNLNAAGITATFIDGVDINCFLAQTITP